MPIFSSSSLDDADALARLAQILHGTKPAGRSTGRKAGRFAHTTTDHPAGSRTSARPAVVERFRRPVPEPIAESASESLTDVVVAK